MSKHPDVQKINCPHCGKEIPLSEVLTKQIEENIKSDYETILQKKEDEYAAQLKQERDKAKEQATKQAQEAASVELEELKAQLIDKSKQLSDSKKRELEFSKRQQELDEKERTIALEVQKQLQVEKNKVVESTRASLNVELTDLRSQVQEKDQKLKESEKTELELRKKQRELDERENKITAEIQKQLESEKEKIIESAKVGLQLELKDMQSQIEEKNRMLANAQNAELELRKRQREIEDREKQLTLEVERRIDEERKSVAEQTRMLLEDDFKLKGKEKDIVIDGLKKQIGELQRKAEQGSNQIQGEAQEVELYEILNAAFRYDTITRIRKGKEGADDFMEVKDSLGNICGSILIESKRTKSWVDGWIDKAKTDQREAKANIMVIVSKILPKDIPHIGNKEGVWICDYAISDRADARFA